MMLWIDFSKTVSLMVIVLSFFAVHIRDPVNPNVVIPIRNFKIRVKNLNAPSPPAQLVNNILSEVVSKSVTTVDLKTRHSLEDLKNGMHKRLNFSFCLSAFQAFS